MTTTDSPQEIHEVSGVAFWLPLKQRSIANNVLTKNVVSNKVLSNNRIAHTTVTVGFPVWSRG